MKRHEARQFGGAAVLGLSLLAFTGCAARRTAYTAPVAPQLTQAERWNTPLAGGAIASPTDDQTLSRWWASLEDPILTSLEERAVKNNLDLRQAEAKIRQARAQRNIAAIGVQPSVTGGMSANGSRTGSKSGGMSSTSQSYGATVDASWEPDFFGKLRGAVTAAQADLESAQADLRNVLVSLTAEVALEYINVRSYQAQLAVTVSSLAAQEETYQLTVARFESGLSTELDVSQAKLSVESARASIPTLETNLRQAKNAIAVLLGERPGAIDAELAEMRPVPKVPASLAVGVPADLVRRRPDIGGAERQVAAQAARVNVAKAELYPSFSLSGTLSLRSLNIANLLTPSALGASAAGGVTNPIFNRRKIREQIQVQSAQLDQTLAVYESTVLGALRDVEDALAAYGQEMVRRQSLAAANLAAGRALELSRGLYSAGLKDFLDVLDAQRSLLSLQNQLAQCDAGITADLVRLYKALGGGWSVTP
jgi:NodT family efflux transporter outer membrane factor (OMF) lipoprotein